MTPQARRRPSRRTFVRSMCLGGLATFGARLTAEERAEIERARAFVETKDDFKEGAAAFAGRR